MQLHRDDGQHCKCSCQGENSRICMVHTSIHEGIYTYILYVCMYACIEVTYFIF